ncbi:MAG: rhomboid family intramembrane serine protease [Planctomycetota bacterium]
MLHLVGNDGPVRYQPFATLTLIASTLFISGALLLSNANWSLSLALELGSSNPGQWLNHVFGHTGWLQLLGDMVFLLCFGTIVEGFIGWRKFIVVYFAALFGTGVLVYLLQFFDGGKGLTQGSSSAVSTLMIWAVILAPASHVRLVTREHSRITRLHHRVRLDVPVLMFVGTRIFWDVTSIASSGSLLSIGFGQTLGVFVGGTMGAIALNRGWIDSDGQDILNRFGGPNRSWKEISWGEVFAETFNGRVWMGETRELRDELDLVKSAHEYGAGEAERLLKAERKKRESKR